MKAVIGFLFFLLFLAGILLVALQGRQTTSKFSVGGGAAMTGVTWRPAYIGAETLPEDSGMFVQFEVDGSIAGHGGCNRFTGSFESTETGVTVGPLASTRMACPEPIMSREQSFLDALQNSTAFEINDDRLRCLDDERNLLIELVL